MYMSKKWVLFLKYIIFLSTTKFGFIKPLNFFIQIFHWKVLAKQKCPVYKLCAQNTDQKKKQQNNEHPVQKPVVSLLILSTCSNLFLVQILELSCSKLLSLSRRRILLICSSLNAAERVKIILVENACGLDVFHRPRVLVELFARRFALSAQQMQRRGFVN